MLSKHETTYEVRIIDWSADVCSSDLQLGPRRGIEAASKEAKGKSKHHDQDQTRPCCRNHLGITQGEISRSTQKFRYDDDIHEASLRQSPARYHPSRNRANRDRKSVGSGKSGSVRVDLGGRRRLKKKKREKKKKTRHK